MRKGCLRFVTLRAPTARVELRSWLPSLGTGIGGTKPNPARKGATAPVWLINVLRWIADAAVVASAVFFV